ncbi:MAG: hypothetical protein ACLQBK_20100 [Candidatus Sulfotelmatobacter sp.]
MHWRTGWLVGKTVPDDRDLFFCPGVNIEFLYEKWLQACDFYPMWRGQTGFFDYTDYYSSLAVMRLCISDQDMWSR